MNSRHFPPDDDENTNKSGSHDSFEQEKDIFQFDENKNEEDAPEIFQFDSNLPNSSSNVNNDSNVNASTNPEPVQAKEVMTSVGFVLPTDLSDPQETKETNLMKNNNNHKTYQGLQGPRVVVNKDNFYDELPSVNVDQNWDGKLKHPDGCLCYGCQGRASRNIVIDSTLMRFSCLKYGGFNMTDVGNKFCDEVDSLLVSCTELLIGETYFVFEFVVCSKKKTQMGEKGIVAFYKNESFFHSLNTRDDSEWKYTAINDRYLLLEEHVPSYRVLSMILFDGKLASSKTRLLSKDESKHWFLPDYISTVYGKVKIDYVNSSNFVNEVKVHQNEICNHNKTLYYRGFPVENDERELFCKLLKLGKRYENFKNLFNREHWNGRNWKMFDQSFQRLCFFLYWLSEQDCVFSLISRDVLTHEVIPYFQNEQIRLYILRNPKIRLYCRVKKLKNKFFSNEPIDPPTYEREIDDVRKITLDVLLRRILYFKFFDLLRRKPQRKIKKVIDYSVVLKQLIYFMSQLKSDTNYTEATVVSHTEEYFERKLVSIIMTPKVITHLIDHCSKHMKIVDIAVECLQLSVVGNRFCRTRQAILRLNSFVLQRICSPISNVKSLLSIMFYDNLIRFFCSVNSSLSSNEVQDSNEVQELPQDWSDYGFFSEKNLEQHFDQLVFSIMCDSRERYFELETTEEISSLLLCPHTTPEFRRWCKIVFQHKEKMKSVKYENLENLRISWSKIYDFESIVMYLNYIELNRKEISYKHEVVKIFKGISSSAISNFAFADDTKYRTDRRECLTTLRFIISLEETHGILMSSEIEVIVEIFKQWEVLLQSIGDIITHTQAVPSHVPITREKMILVEVLKLWMLLTVENHHELNPLRVDSEGVVQRKKLVSLFSPYKQSLEIVHVILWNFGGKNLISFPKFVTNQPKMEVLQYIMRFSINASGDHDMVLQMCHEFLLEREDYSYVYHDLTFRAVTDVVRNYSEDEIRRAFPLIAKYASKRFDGINAADKSSFNSFIRLIKVLASVEELLGKDLEEDKKKLQELAFQMIGEKDKKFQFNDFDSSFFSSFKNNPIQNPVEKDKKNMFLGESFLKISQELERMCRGLTPFLKKSVMGNTKKF